MEWESDTGLNACGSWSVPALDTNSLRTASIACEQVSKPQYRQLHVGISHEN